MRWTNPWLRFYSDIGALGIEASTVIGLRLAKIAVGGPAGEKESERMVEEKVAAAAELGAMAMTGALGFTGAAVTKRTLAHYRRKVRANRRRLSK